MIVKCNASFLTAEFINGISVYLFFFHGLFKIMNAKICTTWELQSNKHLRETCNVIVIYKKPSVLYSCYGRSFYKTPFT